MFWGAALGERTQATTDVGGSLSLIVLISEQVLRAPLSFLVSRHNLITPQNVPPRFSLASYTLTMCSALASSWASEGPSCTEPSTEVQQQWAG